MREGCGSGLHWFERDSFDTGRCGPAPMAMAMYTDGIAHDDDCVLRGRAVAKTT